MILLLTALMLTNGLALVGGTTDGGGLVINEIMIDPQASSSTEMGQWIELYNNNSEWVDISDWSIENNRGEIIRFSSHVIPPNGYFVVGSSSLSFENGNYTPDVVWGTFSLDQTGDLLLSSDDSDIQEFFCWDNSWDIEPGSSLERLNPGWAASDRESWLHSTSSYGDGDRGTPGHQNSVFSNGFGQNTWAFMKAFIR